MKTSIQPSQQHLHHPASRWSRIAFWWVLLAVIAGGIWLRSAGIGGREVWLDEACTHYVVQNWEHWPVDGPSFGREVAHLPFFWLLHLWTEWSGGSIGSLRLFSALCGGFTISLLAAVATQMGGRRMGLTVALLAALNPLQVYYGQEARVYAFWLIPIVGGLFCSYRAAVSPRRRWWLCYAAMTYFGVLIHYHSLFWLPGSIGGWFVARDRRRFLSQWLATHAALALTLLPLLWIKILPFVEGGPKPWLRVTWEGYPPLTAIARSAWAFLPSGGYPSYLSSLGVAGEAAGQVVGPWATFVIQWVPVLVLGGLLIALLATAWLWGNSVTGSESLSTTGSPRGQKPAPRNATTVAIDTSERSRWALPLFLLTAGLMPLVTLWGYSALVSPAYIVARYDLTAWVPCTLGIGVILERIAWAYPIRFGRVSVSHTLPLCLMLGCGSLTLFGLMRVPSPRNVSDRALFVADTVAKDDLVISLGMFRWFLRYDWNELGFQAEVHSFPRAHDRQLCWQDPEAELANVQQIRAEAQATVSRIVSELSLGRRVWLLAHGEPTGPRWEVDLHLFEGLRRAGISAEPVNDWSGLARLSGH